ncbi:MAG TPA: ADOP family duplicated permease [Bryobacteraceae bacterium]|nr:ADOP family duplicated permease [Bryobacteraceae bacterium]
MRAFFLKLRRRHSLERDLATELAFHREMSSAHGNPIPVGNVAVIQEQSRDLWRFTRIENLWRDIVHGARSLRRSPALVITAVLSLGLGIGINTGIFSLAVEFLFSEPSITDARSVVSVKLGGNSHAKKEVVEFVRASGLFQDVVGENEETYINWNDGVDTRQIFSAQLTKNYFAALGIPMAFGRGILPSDPGEVVVLGNHFWRSRLRGDPAIVGRTLRLDSRPYTVVGILPANFRSLIGFGYAPDVYVPRYLDDTILALYARLKPGMTIGQARAGLVAVAQRLDKVMPEPFRYAGQIQVAAVGGMERIKSEIEMQTVGLFFVMLLVVVGLVLLIACVNVASLLLARGSARRQELAIRLSLGAGHSRLIQQLLIEAAWLSLLGVAFGLLLRDMMATAVERFQPPLPIPIRLHMSLDWRVTLYAILLACFATMACGLLPALRSIRHSIAPNLRRQGRMRLQRTLVAGQLALSLIVLTASFLFLRNLWKSSCISPGFDIRRTVYADVNLPPQQYKEIAHKRLYVEQALRDLSALPGIESAAAARVIPFTGATRFMTGLKLADTGTTVRAFFYWNAVSPDYFRAMGIRMERGQTFQPSADAATHPVIVNRTFALRYLADRDPLGRAFRWGESQVPYTVVGIVDDAKNFSLGEDDQPQLYEDLARIDNDRTRVEFVLRTATPPATQLQAVRAALRRVEPNAGLEVATLYSSIGLAFLPSQAGAALLGSIGVLGLLLAAIGLYGVMVYSVSLRTREIGVRLALGANRQDIAFMLLASAARLVLAGSAAGLLCAFFLVKPLALFLVPGLHPNDPLSFLAVAALLALTGLAAAWGPARRAATVDPVTSLRYE